MSNFPAISQHSSTYSLRDSTDKHGQSDQVTVESGFTLRSVVSRDELEEPTKELGLNESETILQELRECIEVSESMWKTI